MTIIGGKGHRYVCSNRHSGPGCDNDLGVARRLAEDLILELVKAKLLQPEFIAYSRRYARRLAATPAQKPDPRLVELKRLVSNGVLCQQRRLSRRCDA